ncbi:MAG: M23 family metallopeptidase [Chloroflexi bacterium]|nr:M23 family metallopeptidase [Chloroflexota bacterium]
MAGRVTQEFGCTGFSWEPPLGNCRHFHKGIDIAAPLGRAIRASAAGLVLIAGPNPYERGSNRAWLVAIAHSSELITWYGHLKTNIPVKVGQYVKVGQIIGYEGMTGRTTGPHLHWAVQFQGNYKNPRLFL